jgi:hypothetical protein
VLLGINGLLKIKDIGLDFQIKKTEKDFKENPSIIYYSRYKYYELSNKILKKFLQSLGYKK